MNRISNETLTPRWLAQPPCALAAAHLASCAAAYIDLIGANFELPDRDPPHEYLNYR